MEEFNNGISFCKVYSNGYMHIKGWIYKKNEHIKSQNIYLQLNENKLIQLSNIITRNDVFEKFTDCKNKYCGFEHILHIGNTKLKKFKIAIQEQGKLVFLSKPYSPQQQNKPFDKFLIKRKKINSPKKTCKDILIPLAKTILPAKIQSKIKQQTIPKENLYSYFDLILERVKRIEIQKKLAIILTEDTNFSINTLKWLKNHSLNLAGIYTNNSQFIGKEYSNLKVKNIDSLLTHSHINNIIAIIPSTNKQDVENWITILNMLNIEYFTFLQIPKLHKKNLLLDKYNYHQGQTAWILGNGPSVKYDKLNKLTSKLVMACNRFHMSYEHHDLRPEYTVCTDLLMMSYNGLEIIKNNDKQIISSTRCLNQVSLSNEERDKIIEYPFIPRPTGIGPQCAFSHDLTKGFADGNSGIYILIQFAVWAGVKNIILYGIDHNFKIPGHLDGELNSAVKAEKNSNNHFIKNYRKKNEYWYTPSFEYIEKAFEVALETCNARKINIVNATHGGKLEIFPRISFNEALQFK